MMTFSPEQLALLQNALTPPAPLPVILPSALPPHQPLASPRPPLGTPAVPLWPVLFAYPVFALLLALVSVLTPASLLPVALVATPALALPLAVHALSAQHAPRLLLALAAAFVVLHPLACWLARPWLLWAAALVLSAFLLLATPPSRGVLGRASAASSALVLLSGGFVAAQAPARLTWGAIVGTLALQSVAATARLRSAALHCSLVDPRSAQQT